MRNWGDYLMEIVLFVCFNVIGIVTYSVRLVLTNDRRIKVLQNEIKSQNEIREVQHANMARRQDELLSAVVRLQDIIVDKRK